MGRRWAPCEQEGNCRGIWETICEQDLHVLLQVLFLPKFQEACPKDKWSRQVQALGWPSSESTDRRRVHENITGSLKHSVRAAIWNHGWSVSHERREHIFWAFKPFDVHNTNLAEVGHAWLARTSGCRVVLLRACKNVINAIRHEKRY